VRVYTRCGRISGQHGVADGSIQRPRPPSTSCPVREERGLRVVTFTSRPEVLVDADPAQATDPGVRSLRDRKS